MESLNEDMVDVLELREKQLTEMIKMLQKKRRDVRAAVTRLKAETLKPVVPRAIDYDYTQTGYDVPDDIPVAENPHCLVCKTNHSADDLCNVEENSGGNNEVCACRSEGLSFHKDSCPLRVG
jgi:hypothetical protein